MDRPLSFAFVSSSWAFVPLVKRRLVDYMAVEDGPSPVRTFVALYSLLTTAALLGFVYPMPYRTFIARIPAVGWTLVIFGALVAALSSIVLVQLLQEGNPGLVVVHLSACTSVLTYVLGALLYGGLSWDGMAGVVLIAAGVTLTSSPI